MKRGFWVVYGAGVQVLFLFSAYQLFIFLYAGTGDPLDIEPLPCSCTAGWHGLDPNAIGYRLGLDALLVTQYGIHHSLFLAPAVRRTIERFIPSPLYGSFYAMMASATLLLTAWFWQPLPHMVYQTHGLVAALLLATFLASWPVLIYSMNLTGLGFQTGFTPWWAYVRNLPTPRRPFVTTGAYRFLRHPIYLSFLGLLWLVPSMTTDRFLLASLMTMYIYVGSVLKDRRMLFFLGNDYRNYMAQVPGYPGVVWGPLARDRQEP